METIFFYKTILGELKIKQKDNFITEISYNDKKLDGEIKETELIKKAYMQIKEYLEGKRKIFTISTNPEGTEFMKSVWKELEKIPYGETVSYEEIAKRIGKPKAQRAVGMANNKNPIMIIIPCHRVIGKNGALVGYAAGLNIKEKLLNLESENR